MAMPSKAYRWSQPAKTLAVLGDERFEATPMVQGVHRLGRFPPNWATKHGCWFVSPPPKKKTNNLSRFRQKWPGVCNKTKQNHFLFSFFLCCQVDGCVSHLCEPPACHVPVEHGLEQFSERPEHLGRWDRDGDGVGPRVSAFRSVLFFQITGGSVEDAHVVH